MTGGQNEPPEDNVTGGYYYPSHVTFGLSSLSLSTGARDMRCATSGHSAVIGWVEVTPRGHGQLYVTCYHGLQRPTLTHTIRMCSRQEYWMTWSGLFERMLHNEVAFGLPSHRTGWLGERTRGCGCCFYTVQPG